MKRAKGVTLAEIMKATGWQAHTLRGFVSLVGSKGGETIESSKNAAGSAATASRFRLGPARRSCLVWLFGNGSADRRSRVTDGAVRSWPNKTNSASCVNDCYTGSFATAVDWHSVAILRTVANCTGASAVFSRTRPENAAAPAR